VTSHFTSLRIDFRFAVERTPRRSRGVSCLNPNQSKRFLVGPAATLAGMGRTEIAHLAVRARLGFSIRSLMAVLVESG